VVWGVVFILAQLVFCLSCIGFVAYLSEMEDLGACFLRISLFWSVKIGQTV
jgi:hypothetical protein